MSENDSTVSPTKPSASRAGTPKTAVNARFTESYICRVAYAVFLGLALILYGGFFFFLIMLYYFLPDVHVLLCGGYNFFCGMAILAFNYFNGWSNILYFNHRKIVHACMNVLGLAFGIAGIAVSLSIKSLDSLHGILGVISVLFAIIAGVMGPCVLQANVTRHKKEIIHVIFGVTAFTFGTLSIILGFRATKYKTLRQLYNVYSVVCVTIYTLAILIWVLIKHTPCK